MPPKHRLLTVPGIGARVFAEMINAGYTHSGLATRAGISRQTLSNLIHRDLVSEPIIQKIAVSLRQGVPDLLYPEGLATMEQRSKWARENIRGAAGDIEAATRWDVGEERAADDSLSALGLLLEDLRDDSGMTQFEVADWAEISLSTYRRIITGKTEPSIRMMDKFAEMFDSTIPPFQTALTSKRPNQSEIRLGRNLRAWRHTQGQNLHDAADLRGTTPAVVALEETGIAPPDYGALTEHALRFNVSIDTLLRGVDKSVVYGDLFDDDQPEERFPSHLFSPQERMALAKKRRRTRERSDLDYFGFGHRLIDAQFNAHVSFEDIAETTGVPVSLVEHWFDGTKYPTWRQLERLSDLLGMTPWELKFGGLNEQTWFFPNAYISRCESLTAALNQETRAWLYGFLAEIAKVAATEKEVLDIRHLITDPYYYYMIPYVPAEGQDFFLRLVMEERAVEIWRAIVDPAWLDKRADELPPLPPIFTQWNAEDHDRISRLNRAAIDKLWENERLPDYQIVEMVDKSEQMRLNKQPRGSQDSD